MRGIDGLDPRGVEAAAKALRTAVRVAQAALAGVSAEAAPDGTTLTFCSRPDCGLRATGIAPDPNGVRWRPYCSDCMPAAERPPAEAAPDDVAAGSTGSATSRPPFATPVSGGGNGVDTPPSNPYRQAREVENDTLARMAPPGNCEIAWDEGLAAGLAARDTNGPIKMPHAPGEHKWRPTGYHGGSTTPGLPVTMFRHERCACGATRRVNFPPARDTNEPKENGDA